MIESYVAQYIAPENLSLAVTVIRIIIWILAITLISTIYYLVSLVRWIISFRKDRAETKEEPEKEGKEQDQEDKLVSEDMPNDVGKPLEVISMIGKELEQEEEEIKSESFHPKVEFYK